MIRSEFIKPLAYLLERIQKKALAANEMIADYMATHKFLKGPEKAQFLACVWFCIRNQAKILYSFPDKTWTERLESLGKKGLPDCSKAPQWVQWEVPEWLVAHIPEAEKELPALLENPPIILRALGNREEVIQELKAENIAVEPTKRSPYGLVLKEFTNLKNTKVWKRGLIDVQDEGAQLLSLEIGVKEKQSVFDFCAGAGGKSLIFAQIMHDKGFIQAYDITPKKLFELVKRATRAHFHIIKIITKLEKPTKKFDHVVVDAPCSGTGTWRRTPNMRWHLTEKQLAHIVRTQGEILNQAEQYVKTGHFLSYITCSLTKDENEDQIDAFLRHHSNYRVIKQKRYSPVRTQTDGFFLCVMQKMS